jgi:hypothetical protein
VIDRVDNEICTLRWTEDALTSARLRLPSGGHVVIEPDVDTHPLFGRVDRIRTEEDEASSVVLAAVRWASPGFVPPLDRPGALPPGAGTAVLNLLARQAADARTRALRYRGPYPTAALFEALRGSFRVHGDPVEAASRFCEDVEGHALRGRMHEVPVDFEPAPHEWVFVHPRVCIQARTEIERVYVDGRPHDRDGTMCRLRDEGEDLLATLEIAGRRWADVARVDRRGGLVEGPRSVPAVDSSLIGLELPRAVVDVLGEAISSRAPAMLQPTLRDALGTATLCFADTGAALARRTPRAIELHALLGEQLDTMDAHTQLAWFITAVEPVARRWAQEILATNA